MELSTQTHQLIQALEADKQMAQPYKNYAVSDAKRLLALIQFGLHQTNVTPPPDVVLQPSDGCICPPMGRRADCPKHTQK